MTGSPLKNSALRFLLFTTVPAITSGVFYPPPPQHGSSSTSVQLFAQ